MAKLFYNIANNAKTTITNNPLSNSGTSITLSAGTGTKFPSEYFVATIWDDTTYPSNPGGDPNMEIVYCDSRSTDTVTVNSSGRGFGGTTGVQHNSGSSFAILDTKQFEDQMTTALTTGWVPVADTWAYASVDNPTGVVTIPTNGTTTYSVGMRIKFTNGGNTVYGIVTAVAATSLTFLHEINVSTPTQALYIMQNSAITNIYVSHVKTPYGFPSDPRSWTVYVHDDTTRTKSTPEANTWYNLGTIKITIPIGAWDVEYNCDLGIIDTNTTTFEGFVTLSTANNTESNTKMTTRRAMNNTTTNVTSDYLVYTARGQMNISSKTDHFLNAKTSQSNIDTISMNSGSRTDGVRLYARCNYL